MKGYAVIVARFGVLGLLLAFSLPAGTALGHALTEDHLADPGFWPTQELPAREGFVGAEACGRCHAAKVASQKETPMGRAVMSAGVAEILHAHPVMNFAVGSYQYGMHTEGSQTEYLISDGRQKLSYPLAWAFGTGRVAQSYLFKKDDGGFYESRATYFVSLGTLDFTPSRALLSPSSIEEAMYRPVGKPEVQRCFACHSTASTIAGVFDEKHLVPGVSCEACHGAGKGHIAAMDDLLKGKSAGRVQPAIFNSAHLAPADAVDFCGACHGSWWDVKLSGMKGASTARSAPYRLVTSKCWGKGDARLVCTSCHDPHEQLETKAAAYDQKCLNCHVNGPGAKASASHPGVACPAATKDCTSCHMPRVNVPEMHADFTDHRIRIVKAGEPFPD